MSFINQRNEARLVAMPRSTARSPQSLVETSKKMVVDYIVQYLSNPRNDVENLKNYVSSLPVQFRQDILFEIQDEEYQPKFIPSNGGDSEAAKIKILYMVRNFWKVLYCGAFNVIVIPRLEMDNLKQNFPKPRPARTSIRINRGSERTDERQFPYLPIQEAYAYILELVRSEGFSAAKEVHFHSYRTCEATSMKEKSIIFDLTRTLMNIKVLDLGYACDDSMLRELGRLARCLSSLTISGKSVTDEGVRYLCGYLDHLTLPYISSEEENDALQKEINLLEHVPSDVCFTLRHLDISRARNVTEEGVKTALINLKNLHKIHCVEAHFISICSKIHVDDGFKNVKVGLQIVEFRSINRDQEFVENIAPFFPFIQNMTFWPSDGFHHNSLNVPNFEAFSQLHSLTLCRVSEREVMVVVKQIGKQLKKLSIMNKLEHFHMDIGVRIRLENICRELPVLEELNLTMVCCSLNDLPKSFIWSSLTTLNFEQVTFEKNFIFDLLSRCPNLESFKLFSKIKRQAQGYGGGHAQVYIGGHPQGYGGGHVQDFLAAQGFVQNVQAFGVGNAHGHHQNQNGLLELIQAQNVQNENPPGHPLPPQDADSSDSSESDEEFPNFPNIPNHLDVWGFEQPDHFNDFAGNFAAPEQQVFPQPIQIANQAHGNNAGGGNEMNELLEAIAPGLQLNTDGDISDQQLEKLFRKCNFNNLHTFIVALTDYEFSCMKLQKLSEDCLFLLIRNCPNLLRVGNLSHWQLANKELALQRLEEDFGWITVSKDDELLLKRTRQQQQQR